jgi:hypothetical protein
MKLWLVVGAAMLLFLAYEARAAGIAKAVQVLAPLADVVVTFALVAGAAGWAAAPRGTGARGPALGAVVLMVLLALLQLYGLFLLFALTDEQPRVEILRAAQRQLPWIDGLSSVSALAAALLLLSSFRAAAAWIGEHPLAQRAGSLALGLMVMIVVATLFRWSIAAGKMRLMGALFLFAIPLLAGALALVSVYLRLVRALAAAIRRRLR